MRLINILIVYVTIGLNLIYAQVPSSSLFLIANKQKDSIKFYKNDKGSSIGWELSTDIKKNWSLKISHYSTDLSGKSHFRYLLPKKMVQNFIDRGNAISLNNFKRDIYSLDRASLHKKIRLRSYYYEYSEGRSYKKDLRYNIFLIFESDLDKNYVECYELDVWMSSMVEE